MRKMLMGGLVGCLLMLGSLHSAQAQSQLLFIPTMTCSGALNLAQGPEQNQFYQWYNGYLQALYSQGKADIAFTLYFNPGILQSICAANPSLPVWRLMEQAIAQIEAGQ